MIPSLFKNQEFIDAPFKVKRYFFLRWLLNIAEFKLKHIKITDKWGLIFSKPDFHRGMPQLEGHTYGTTPEFKVYAMSHDKDGFFLPEGTYYNGLNFELDWDTRDILLSEGILELEKGTPEENYLATRETIINLHELRIGFAVFYAEGMRTYHIHLYNLFPNAQDWAEKNAAMAFFAQRIVPEKYHRLLDTALFEEHTIALEFAKHHRTKHIKKLILYYEPLDEVDTFDISLLKPLDIPQEARI